MGCKTFCGSKKSTCMSSLFCLFILIALGMIGAGFYVNITYFGKVDNWVLSLIFAGIALVAVIFCVSAICTCRYIIRRNQSIYD